MKMDIFLICAGLFALFASALRVEMGHYGWAAGLLILALLNLLFAHETIRRAVRKIMGRPTL